MFGPARHPIGIDVGAHGARMLQLDARVGEANRPHVAAAARMSWPADVLADVEPGRAPPVARVAEHLRRMLNRGAFRGRDVAVLMPRENVRIKNLRLPMMPPDEAVAAALLDARDAFDDLGAANVQVLSVQEVRQGNESKLEAIVACCEQAEIDALVEAWHDAGFRPASVDLEPTALYRGVDRFVRRKEDEGEVHVLVEIGHRRTAVLIGRGRELQFFKSIEIGGARLTQAVARKLALDLADTAVLRKRLAATAAAARGDATAARPAADDPVRQAVTDGLRPPVEEIARELSLCLRYFSVNFRGQRPTRVRVVGGESADPIVVRLLEKALPVPVAAAAPLASADCGAMSAADRVAASMGDWTLAFGLALRFAKGPFADLNGPARAPNALRIEPDAADAASPPRSGSPAMPEVAVA